MRASNDTSRLIKSASENSFSANRMNEKPQRRENYPTPARRMALGNAFGTVIETVR